MEVNADEMVIKSDSEEEMLVDIKETLERLQVINLKLDLKKCSFEVEEGREKMLPFMQTLKNCTSGKMIQCTTKANKAFRRMKELLEPLPIVTALVNGKTLIVYLLASEESIRLMLVDPEGKEYTYALRFKFETTNNKAEYEALLAGLRIAKEMKIQELIIFVDSQLVANQVNGLFEARKPVIKQYLEKAKELLVNFPTYSKEHIKRDQNKKACALSKLLAKEVLVELLQEKSITQKEIILVTMVKVRKSITSQGHHPRGPLPIAPGGASLPPPSKRTGRSKKQEVVKGKERRLGKTHQGWVDVLPQVLWAYRTTLKSSNGETPFSLVYGSEAIISIEISVETRRIQDFDPKKNKKKTQGRLDILKERR
nr:reverse transcriptase domain-containing protein [Tanacetum cinerariifolium]